ncbi:hypothetical protein D3C86_1624890 [compost metagenome]
MKASSTKVLPMPGLKLPENWMVKLPDESVRAEVTAWFEAGLMRVTVAAVSTSAGTASVVRSGSCRVPFRVGTVLEGTA